MSQLMFGFAIAFALITMTGLLGSSSIAEAASCGANNQRPCNFWERIPSCNKGLYERNGRCLAKVVPGRDCGRANQRPCLIWERIPSCNNGLVEDLLKGRCVPKAIPGKDCGRANQRPCLISERIPSCNKGLVEHLPTNRCTSLADLGNQFQCGKQNQKPCKILERIPSCDKGLVENFLTRRCEIPSQVNVFQQLTKLAEKQQKQNEALIKQSIQLVKELNGGTKIAKTIRDHLAAKRWKEAARSLNQLSSYRILVANARKQHHNSLTVGLAGDAQAGIGVNTEVGVAIDLAGTRPVKGFTTLGLSLGIALGVDAGVNVGVWADANDRLAGDSQGIVFAGNVGVGINHGIWAGYPPKGQCCIGKFNGFTVGLSVGIGAEIGEYNRVTTVLF